MHDWNVNFVNEIYDFLHIEETGKLCNFPFPEGISHIVGRFWVNKKFSFIFFSEFLIFSSFELVWEFHFFLYLWKGLV